MLTKLSLRSTFTDDERGALLALPVDEARLAAHATIAHPGDTATRACVLLDGYAARYKLLPDGSRQIVALHIAGDLMDLQSAVLKAADHGIVALGHARVAYLPHPAVLAVAERFPGIARAFWLETLVDGAIYAEWLLNVGQRDAYGRLAHLFCEMLMRSDAVGLSRGESFPFPVSQGELGDATGLTAIHVNRTMQQLRKDGLVSTRGTDMCVEDWHALVQAGSFDPTYLHLPN
jgi:CRP-like cAMP-binding protein